MRTNPLIKIAILTGLSIAFGQSCALTNTEKMSSSEIESAQHKPNVVLFYVDDLGWKDVGFMGSQYYQTSNIDELSAQGMVFDNAYANAPNCAPSRAALLSGQYGPRTGVYTVQSSARGKAELRKLVPIKNTLILNDDNWTLADAFKEAGYATASMGKFHVGKDPLDYGFDVNIAGSKAGGPYSGSQYFSPYDNPNLSDGPEGEYLTDRLTTEAIEFTKQQSAQGKPFFLYLTHFAVHSPIQAKPELASKYKGKKPYQGQQNPAYAAMIESTDQSLGRLIDSLKAQGVYNNTVIVFTSDNGGSGAVTKASPLSGDKGSMYEGGYRVPFFISWQNNIVSGSKSSVPVIATDLFPTFLDIMGLEKPIDKVLDGVSLLPLVKNKAELEREAIFWHFPAYLTGSKKKGIWRSTPFGAIRKGKYKLIEFFEDGHLELYDLEKDISESNNLAKQLPDITANLHQNMLKWRHETNAPVPTQVNLDFNQKALVQALNTRPIFVR